MVLVIARLTVVEVFGEFVGVMVTVCALVGTAILPCVEMVTEIVAGFVPSKVTLEAAKEQLAPVGSPLQLLGLKFTTIPVDPLIALRVKVTVADCPATRLRVVGLAESWKSGANDAFHAAKKELKSIEPRPVTKS